MIEFRPVVLENESEMRLRHWFKAPEYKILLQVIEAKITEHQTAALKAAMDSKRFEKYNDAANDDLSKAIRLKDCLDVLDELKNQKDPFQLFKPVNPG